MLNQGSRDTVKQSTRVETLTQACLKMEKEAEKELCFSIS